MENDPEERRDALVTPEIIRATARVNPVRIRMRPHLWPTWAEIAIDQEANARVARASELKLAAEEPGKQGLGDLLLWELEASLASIAAASHSLDALYGVLVEMVIEPELREKWREKRESGKKGPPRHRQVFETIKRAVVTEEETLTRWIAEFKWLFDLRDAAVHHREETADSVPHPSGTTNSSAIHLSYCVETSERAVNLLIEVLAQGVSSGARTRPTSRSGPTTAAERSSAYERAGATDRPRLTRVDASFRHPQGSRQKVEVSRWIEAADDVAAMPTGPDPKEVVTGRRAARQQAFAQAQGPGQSPDEQRRAMKRALRKHGVPMAR